MASFRRNISNSFGAIILVAAIAFQRGIPLLLLPVVSRNVSSGEFGQISLLIGAGILFTTVFSRGIPSIIPKFVASRTESSKTSGVVALCNDTMKFSFGISIALAGIFLCSAAITGDFFFIYLIEVVTASLLGTFLNLVQAALITFGKTPVLFVITSIQTLSTFFVSLLVIPKFGISGYFISIIIGSCTSICLFLLFSKKYIGINTKSTYRRVDLIVWRIRSRPFVYQGVANWALTYPDKLLIGGVLGASILGSYQVALSIAGIVALIIEGISAYWSPRYISLSIRNVSALNKYAVFLAGIAFSFGAIAVINLSTISHFLAPDYDVLRPVATIVIGGMVPRAFYFIFSVKLNDLHKNIQIFYATVIGSVAALLIAIFMVKLCGPIGVASALAFGYLIQASLSIIFVNRAKITANILILLSSTFVYGCFIAILSLIQFKSWSLWISLLLGMLAAVLIYRLFKSTEVT